MDLHQDALGNYQDALALKIQIISSSNLLHHVQLFLQAQADLLLQVHPAVHLPVLQATHLPVHHQVLQAAHLPVLHQVLLPAAPPLAEVRVSVMVIINHTVQVVLFLNVPLINLV